MERLKESNEQLKQGKESAEKQSRAISAQMASSLNDYRKGLDDILQRNKAEFEESRKKCEEEIVHLRKQVCLPSGMGVFREGRNGPHPRPPVAQEKFFFTICSSVFQFQFRWRRSCPS